MGTAKVLTGLDQLVNNNFDLLGKAKVGIVANPASINCELKHVVDLVLEKSACNVRRLFGPEHGLGGALQDMEIVSDSVDSSTKIPISSLYGSSEESLRPNKEHLAELDILLFDLQDIGTRYYTYAQTLAYTMMVAAETGTKVIVLDRPNPIGGLQIEGAALHEDFRSFCGLHPIANRHGMTIGELAKLMQSGFGEGSNRVEKIDVELQVVELQNWKREMYFEDTGLPWVMPSPNMPTMETAVVYPGACLFEGTAMSEARGTTKPFELIGAPYVNSSAWIEMINSQELDLSGARLRPLSFVPQFQKCKKEVCHGVQIHVENRNTFHPFRLGLAMISAAKECFPEHFAWRRQAYEFVDKHPAIDLLYGDASFRETVDSGKKLGRIDEDLKKFESWFENARKPFLLYE